MIEEKKWLCEPSKNIRMLFSVLKLFWTEFEALNEKLDLLTFA